MTKPNEKLVEFPRQSARDILTEVDPETWTAA